MASKRDEGMEVRHDGGHRSDPRKVGRGEAMREMVEGAHDCLAHEVFEVGRPEDGVAARIVTLEARVAHLERLLSLALPVARAAVAAEHYLIPGTPGQGAPLGGLARELDALSPEQRAEIVEGGEG